MALISNASGKVAVSTVTETELEYLSGVSSSVQTQLNSKQGNLSQAQLDAVNSGIDSTKVSSYDSHLADTDIHVTTSDKSTWSGKQDAITGAATTITSNNLTADKILVSDANGKVSASSTATTNLSKIDYLANVTSDVQTQLNSKQGTLTAGNGIDITSNTISATNIVWATYGTTAFTDVLSAYTANKEVLVKYAVDNVICRLSAYDASIGRLVFTNLANIRGTYQILLDDNDSWSIINRELVDENNPQILTNKTLDKSLNKIIDNSIELTANTSLSSTASDAEYYRRDARIYLNGNGISLTLPNMTDSNAISAEGIIRYISNNDNTNSVVYYKADGTSATETLAPYAITAYEAKFDSTNGIYWEKAINLLADLQPSFDAIIAQIPVSATSSAVQPVITNTVTQPVFDVDTFTQPTISRTTDMDVTSTATSGDYTLSHNVSGTKLTLTGSFTQPTITNSLTQPAFTASGGAVTISRTTDVSVTSTNSSVTPTITLSTT